MTMLLPLLGRIHTPAVVDSVQILESGSSIAVGETLQLTPIALDASGNEVTGRVFGNWRSDDMSIATVDASGLVTARAVGAVTISVDCTRLDGSTVTGSGSFTTTGAAADTTAPAAPTGLTGPGAAPTGLSWGLTWDLHPNTDGDLAELRLYYATGGADPTGLSPYQVMSTDPTATAGTFGASAATTVYRQALAAVDASGNVSTLSNIVEVTSGEGAAVVAPTISDDPMGQLGATDLSVAVSPYAYDTALYSFGSWKLYYGTSAGITTGSAAKTVDWRESKLDAVYLRGLTPSTTYHVRAAVVLVSLADGTLVESPLSNELAVATNATPQPWYENDFSAGTMDTTLSPRGWGFRNLNAGVSISSEWTHGSDAYVYRASYNGKRNGNNNQYYYAGRRVREVWYEFWMYIPDGSEGIPGVGRWLKRSKYTRGLKAGYVCAYDVSLADPTLVTLSTAPVSFVVYDVGEEIQLYGAGAAGVDLITTITEFIDSTHVRVADAAQTAVTGGPIRWRDASPNGAPMKFDSIHPYEGAKSEYSQPDYPVFVWQFQPNEYYDRKIPEYEEPGAYLVNVGRVQTQPATQGSVNLPYVPHVGIPEGDDTPAGGFRRGEWMLVRKHLRMGDRWPDGSPMTEADPHGGVAEIHINGVAEAVYERVFGNRIGETVNNEYYSGGYLFGECDGGTHFDSAIYMADFKYYLNDPG